MSRAQTSSVRVDPELWREAKLLATSRNMTIGRPVEKLLKKELEEARKGVGKLTKKRAEPSTIRSPLRYPGGKSKVTKIFLKFVPPHASYIEPFAGGASMFLSKPLAERSWINDIHPGLYAFYVALRDHYDEFSKMCLMQKGDLRRIFDYWARERADLMQLTGDQAIVERAVQFFFINRTVWVGRVVYDPARKSRLYFSNPEGWKNIEKKLENLKKISEKLQGVKITCLPFEECFKDVDSRTFIYCDPPYYRDSICSNTDRLYDEKFPIEAHKRLARLANASIAKMMISYDDRDEVRMMYSNPKWRIVELKWKYCGRHALTKEQKQSDIKERKVLGNELLIMNY